MNKIHMTDNTSKTGHFALFEGSSPLDEKINFVKISKMIQFVSYFDKKEVFAYVHQKICMDFKLLLIKYL